MCIPLWNGRGKWLQWLRAACFFLLVSCEHQRALPPAYLRIGSARVIIETDTLFIEAPVDAWVYPEGKYLTLVEPGGRIPIVPASIHPILLAGGVRASGISVMRRPYPFWQFDTIKVPLAAETEFYHTPLYTYLPDTLLKYLLKEDFESPQLGFRVVNAGEPYAVNLRRTLQNPRRGFWSGEVLLEPNSDFRLESLSAFELPREETWLEISLRGSRNLSIGLTIEERQTGRLVGRELYLLLRPSQEQWSTFYIPISPWMAAKGELFRYRLYLASMGDTIGTHFLYLDDIRVITFKHS
ncbi:MAG: hypothetical protein RMJ66_00250 [Bacteroidia bacterium]|nr:hypothetical protein [Bacteroidia bacterium]MDW8133474.1 hypothetical protein [Bacteroidia bacterium]